MSSTRGGPKAGKPTIDCHRLPLDGRPFDPDAFLTKDRNANNQSKPSTQAGSKSTDRILTTPQLVSALTGIWNLVGQPESSCTAQRSESHGILHKDEPVFFSGEQKEQTVTSCCAENSTGLISQNFLSTPKSIFEDLSLVKKTLMLTSCSSMTGGSSVWRHMHVGSAYYIHQNIYPMRTRMMHTYAVSGSSELKENQCFRRDDNHSNQTRNMPTESCTSSSEVAHSYESSLHGTKSNVEKIPEYCSSSSCSSQQIVAGEEPRIIPADQISSNTCTLIENSCTSCLVDDAVVVNSDREDQNADGLMSQKHSVDNYSPQLEPNAQHQSYGAVTLNRHAVAGALAGTVVSVSLHPIDTVKTIIQVNSSGRSSFYHTLRHTLVERGVLGLYGGLGSKIACSAPISAIYTLTYEIVKGALLPILPKEYYSVAHCAAGGCSSIATSFVFTPSECIKQQMQVGSKYQNCWDALLGSLRRGGITSLYAGWGAVLCRNIPHSIVKFYTYENLKQFMLKSAPPNANLDSGQTLLCGGFAGSTAALFTTPFDVVKTRVQLQALSPVSKYKGVLHALKEISQREGLQGLYRGLAPRLAMYVSQGAIFFTSYEFLKTIMFSEQELPGSNF
ncbi:adenine nucleotide transporter BT1, chloroplastic/amyloplastic/mitochondrial isoform X2 [Oryza brachyantha]|uniref:Uncharacterized protein n=1 Tax=Oryza brachyantha TaxID=4533 RepID=J3LFL0_ORYBR|nr:adenine nucleotide transporter BT1, chloroplastic/amyloplastic/mitochondrial isoform X2 [Oryza brachyantha]